MKCNIIFSSANVCLSQVLYLRSGAFFRCYKGPRKRNPHEVLGLKNTCSMKDVKKAYIKLCKELHPDVKPGDVDQHKKFIELNEAYNALLNPDSKSNNISKQDSQDPDIIRKHKYNEKSSQTNQQSKKAWYESEDYKKYYRQPSKEDLKNKDYRKANLSVLAGCFILMVLGSVLYASAYKFATRYTLENVDKRSKKINKSLSDSKSTTINKSRDEFLDDFKRKWSK